MVFGSRTGGGDGSGVGGFDGWVVTAVAVVVTIMLLMEIETVVVVMGKV